MHNENTKCVDNYYQQLETMPSKTQTELPKTTFQRGYVKISGVECVHITSLVYTLLFFIYDADNMIKLYKKCAI